MEKVIEDDIRIEAIQLPPEVSVCVMITEREREFWKGGPIIRNQHAILRA